MNRKINLFERASFFFRRLTHFEYWPYQVFYFPLFFYGFYLALKSKSVMYFDTTNPCMRFGGVMGESKKKILDKMGSDMIPKTLLFNKGISAGVIKSTLQKAGLLFPIIVKPDQGERGRGVEKVDDFESLKNYLTQYPEKIIVQEFISYPLEFGVFYYRHPEEEYGHLTSVVQKAFLSVTGDGRTTLEELVEKEARATPRRAYLKNKYRAQWLEIVPEGKKILLEPIGNHCRGTMFVCANDLINQKLIAVFDKIAKKIDGYYYGRFDIKVPNLLDLYEGKNIKILELNGVSSEPAHIYDPDYSLFRAYKVVMQHMDIIYMIAKANHQAGYKRKSFGLFLKEFIEHFQRVKARNASLSH